MRYLLLLRLTLLKRSLESTGQAWCLQCKQSFGRDGLIIRISICRNTILLPHLAVVNSEEIKIKNESNNYSELDFKRRWNSNHCDRYEVKYDLVADDAVFTLLVGLSADCDQV